MFKPPNNLGVEGGRLSACPDQPNCVSSQSDDPLHSAEPMPFDGNAEEAFARLRAVVDGQPRSTIVADAFPYLHAELRSLIFRFVDDVEFYVDVDAGLIHFRSAARLGRSDLGVNRRRIERIRTAFAAE